VRQKEKRKSTLFILKIFSGFLTKTPLHKLFYSLLGCALFVTSGVFIIDAWEGGYRTRTRDLAILKGAFAIMNGVVFFMDAIFRFRTK
jgi:hypothetical protein